MEKKNSNIAFNKLKYFLLGLFIGFLIMIMTSSAKADFRTLDIDLASIFSTLEKSHTGNYNFTIVKDVEAETQYIIVDDGNNFQVLPRWATNGTLYINKG